MTRRALLLAVSLAAAVLVVRPDVSAQTNPWVLEWLTDYAAGHQAEVAARLRTVADLKVLQDDLEKLRPTWTGVTDGSAELHRRAIAAFALEAAYGRLDLGEPATKLLEWGCRQIRRHPKPDEFDHRWLMAAFALFGGAVDPDGLETHVLHVKFLFPKEPRLALERAMAEELRTAPFGPGAKLSDTDLRKHREEAARRFAAAAKIDATRAEANLRLGHVDIDLGKYDEALQALDQVEPNTHDAYLVYLERLFRGRALDRVGRLNDAAAAYEQAMTVEPGAQSASVALASLFFRHGQRGDADQLVGQILGHAVQPADPWWLYWPADYRMADDLVASMREAMK
jgi:tetratricopeptide (TPR) repeat protein